MSGNPVSPEPAARASGTTRRVTFDLGAKSLPVDDLDRPKPSEKRLYDKLSFNAKFAILTQKPSGFRESSRSFAVMMHAGFNRVHSELQREAPYDKNIDRASNPYIPQPIKLNATLQLPDDLKDNTEANLIVTQFNTEKHAALVMLTKQHKRLAQLRTRLAKENRLKSFVTGTFELISERVYHYIDFTKEGTCLQLNGTQKELTAITFIKFINLLGESYFKEYLDTTPNAVLSLILSHVAVDEDDQKRLKILAGLEQPPTTDSSSSENDPSSTTTYKLTNDAVELIDDILKKFVPPESASDHDWFKTITLHSEETHEQRRKDEIESARIKARRKAKAIETATEQTAIALSGNAESDIKKLKQLIIELQDSQKKALQAAKRSARKKSSGGPGPRAKPDDKKQKKQNGPSRNGSSKQPSRTPKPKPKEQQKSKGNEKSTKGKQKQKRKGKNQGGNNKGGKGGKRQRR